MPEIPAPVYAALAALMMAVTALIQEWIRAKREKAAAEKVAAEVAEVKATLVEKDKQTDAKLDSMADVGEKTHTLVNSNMALQLSLNKAVTRRLANMTKDPADEDAAQLAARLYDEHLKKQAIVDAKEDTRPRGDT